MTRTVLNLRLAWPLAAIAGFAAPAGAEGLDEIIVTATRIEQSASRVPAAVSIIDGEDVQRARQQLALDESLAGVPGLFLQDRYNFAQDLRISIRGFGARSSFGIRGVKILVDGIPESLPDGQGQSDGIDLGSVGRIEVLRGPSSSLYGNASGGVIAIDTERGPDDPFIETRLTAGEYDLTRVQLKAGGQTGRVNYLVNVSDMDFDGYRDNSETENTQLSGRFEIAVDDRSEFGITLAATDQPVANDPGGINAAAVEADPSQARDRNLLFLGGEAIDQQKIGFTYRRELAGRHELALRNYYLWRDFENRLPFEGGGIVNFDRAVSGGGIVYRFAGERNTFVAGLDVDRQDDDRRRFDNLTGTRGPLVFDQNEKVASLGAFVQNEFQVGDSLALTTGIRFDEVEFDVADRFLVGRGRFGQPPVERSSARCSDVSFAACRQPQLCTVPMSTSFETPTTTEFANPSGGGGFNPAIDPQTATNYEVGARGLIAGAHRYEIAWFSIDVEDELIPFELASQPGRDFFENAGASSRNGIEAAIVSQLTPSLELSAAYTYSDFEFDRFVEDGGNGDDFSGNTLPGIPEQQFRAALTWENDAGLFVSADLLHVGDIYLNNANTAEARSYTVSNVRAGFTHRVKAWEFSPFAGVNNLTDEDYSANIRINAFGGRYFEPAPPRHVYAGIAIRYDFGAR